MSNRIDCINITSDMKRFDIKDNSDIINTKSNVGISHCFKQELLENLIIGNPNINDIEKL